MATIYHDAQDIYCLKSELNSLTISVESGDQEGAVYEEGAGYFIFNDSKLVGPNKPGQIYKGADCVDNWITVVAVIKDKLTETNWTSLSICFKEEGERQVIFGPYKREVEKHLDTVVYTIKIKVRE